MVRQLIFNVRNQLGAGWSEEVYHQALSYALQEEGVPFVSKPRRPLLHCGVEVHLFEPDIIAWNTVILELKILPFLKEFTKAHYAQLIQYLKFFGKDLGLLVNFAPYKVKIKRVVWDEPEWNLVEDYDKIKPDLNEHDKVYLRQIRQHILSLVREYGLGYPETIYRKLLAVEATHHQLDCVSDVSVSTTWNGYPLARHITQHLLIANNYLVHIRALLHFPTTYDFIATRTYLKNLDLSFALVVNFGKDELQIYGVKRD
ncbi:MAG: GxxExxY protein [Chloroflexi bacterium]|nr:GxxExxY protein [Chloroflexota bacterium]